MQQTQCKPAASAGRTNRSPRRRHPRIPLCRLTRFRRSTSPTAVGQQRWEVEALPVRQFAKHTPDPPERADAVWPISTYLSCPPPVGSRQANLLHTLIAVLAPSGIGQASQSDSTQTRRQFAKQPPGQQVHSRHHRLAPLVYLVPRGEVFLEDCRQAPLRPLRPLPDPHLRRLIRVSPRRPPPPRIQAGRMA
jgi:hypothetical protein